MNVRVLQSGRLLAAAVFVAATVVLAVQLITPSPVMVSVGENGADATQLGQYFTYRDAGVVAVAAALLGASGTYLVLEGRVSTSAAPGRSLDPSSARAAVSGRDRVRGDGLGSRESRRREWEEAAERLSGNEHDVYAVVLEADGELAQRDIVEETDLSKATVSRTLDALENRGLVERRRRGMGNVVLLR